MGGGRKRIGDALFVGDGLPRTAAPRRIYVKRTAVWNPRWRKPLRVLEGEHFGRASQPMFVLTQSIQLSNCLLANFRGLVLGCIEADFDTATRKTIEADFAGK